MTAQPLTQAQIDYLKQQLAAAGVTYTATPTMGSEEYAPGVWVPTSQIDGGALNGPQREALASLANPYLAPQYREQAATQLGAPNPTPAPGIGVAGGVAPGGGVVGPGTAGGPVVTATGTGSPVDLPDSAAYDMAADPNFAFGAAFMPNGLVPIPAAGGPGAPGVGSPAGAPGSPVTVGQGIPGAISGLGYTPGGTGGNPATVGQGIDSIISGLGYTPGGTGGNPVDVGRQAVSAVGGTALDSAWTSFQTQWAAFAAAKQAYATSPTAGNKAALDQTYSTMAAARNAYWSAGGKAGPDGSALSPAQIRGTGGTQAGPAAPAGSPASGTAGAPGPSGVTSAQRDAYAVVQNVLDTYGLGSLSQWAWQQILNGASDAEVQYQIRQTPEFKQAFPEIEARQKAGLPPLSPGDIVTYRNTAQQMMREAGLPQGYWDQPGDFVNLLANNVSINELQHRLQLATQAAYEVPADVRATLARDYGVGAGKLAAFFLDPTRAEPLITRDFTAAQIGGAGLRTGYGSTKSEDEYLAGLGVGGQQAQQGFSTLAGAHELFDSLPGENTTGIDRQDQIGAMFAGNANAQRKIARRTQERQAVFAGGGQFAGNNSGLAGLGAASGA